MSQDFVDIPDTVNVNDGFRLTDYKEVIAATASISTILQFLSGALVCQKFIHKGTTSDASSLQFVSGFLSCVLWMSYGMLINDSSIIMVNSVGTILFMCYIFIFYMYCSRKITLVKQVVGVLTLMATVRVYTNWVADEAVARLHLGRIASGTTLMFFSAPLADLTYVFRMKSTDSLPFPMILMTFIVCFQWLLYGIILDNPVIQYPNLAGCILSLFQLTLFIIYPSR